MENWRKAIMGFSGPPGGRGEAEIGFIPAVSIQVGARWRDPAGTPHTKPCPLDFIVISMKEAGRKC